jgi:hypothetical protein
MPLTLCVDCLFELRSFADDCGNCRVVWARFLKQKLLLVGALFAANKVGATPEPKPGREISFASLRPR